MRTRQARVRLNGDCLEWMGAQTAQGYGQTSIGGRRMLAHRAAWVLAHGEIPPAHCVLHRCDNPRCVRIEHLFLGTQRDNMRDMRLKGRAARHVRRARHLSPALVREIRARYQSGQISQAGLARELGLHQTTINQIITGRLHRSVA